MSAIALKKFLSSPGKGAAEGGAVMVVLVWL